MPHTTAAERKRIEAEKHDKAIFAALAWPQEPCPQPWSKDDVSEMGWARPGGQLVRAWTYNAYSKRVTHGAFGVARHVTEGDGSGIGSQGPGGPWFATEAEARLALRWAVCREMAETLHRLVEAEAIAVVREGAPATA